MLTMIHHVLCRLMKVVVSRRVEIWRSFTRIKKMVNLELPATRLPQTRKTLFAQEERRLAELALPASAHI